MPMIIVAALLLSLSGGFSRELQGAEDSDWKIRWDTLRCDLKLKVDYETETLAGRCRLTLRNGSDGDLSEVPILLYRLLRVHTVESGGKTLAFRQNVRIFEDMGRMPAGRRPFSAPWSGPSPCTRGGSDR